jgi:hypothetical protein
VTDELLRLGTEAVRELWPLAVLTSATQLAGSDRNVVARAEVLNGPVTTVVVKRHVSVGGARVREPAALECLAGTPGVPQLLAAHPTEPLMVMADLGTGDNVAHRLLGSDPLLAADGIQGWAVALGRLHSAGASATAGFAAALERHAGRLGVTAVPPSNAMPLVLADAAERLVELLPPLGVTPSVAALDQLRGIDAGLGGPDAVRLITPSDACPDNNTLTEAGLALLDFEGAQVRHVAWDAAYLTVPWPSCWCSWLMPEAVAAQALQVWTGECGLAYARSEEFGADLVAASVGWALISTAWFLESALDADEHLESAPARRALIQHRLAQAATAGGYEALGSLAAEVLSATRAAWGGLSVALAPAFR